MKYSIRFSSTLAILIWKNILEQRRYVNLHSLIDVLLALDRIYVAIEYRAAESLVDSIDENVVLYTEHINGITAVVIGHNPLHKIKVCDIVEMLVQRINSSVEWELIIIHVSVALDNTSDILA